MNSTRPVHDAPPHCDVGHVGCEAADNDERQFWCCCACSARGPLIPLRWRDDSNDLWLVRRACCCWCSDAALQPTLRPWTTGLFDTGGCIDALMCGPCQGSRQMMALAGWEDSFHVGWTVFFLLHFAVPLIGGNTTCFVPPCAYRALTTRLYFVSLERIDEHLWSTILQAIFCSVCSLAQTRRELDAVGVRPEEQTVGKAASVAEIKMM